MNSTDLPSLPRSGEYGPEVCVTVQLYLAILDDVSPEQRQLIIEHLEHCAACSQEFRLLNLSTQLVASLPASTPSPDVDAALLAAFSSTNKPIPSLQEVTNPLPASQKRNPEPIRPLSPRHRMTRRPSQLIGSLAAAAAVLLALLTSLHFLSISSSSSQVFALPAHLSWSGYVIYHVQKKVDGKGMQYQVSSYHNMNNGMMHVETTQDGLLDVVAVGDESAMLGLDMMHHIAQWGAYAWGTDDSAFDLTLLRRDLQAKRAQYMGKGTFNGQPVYRIRYSGGLVLLLDMRYRPVNLLRNTSGSTMGEPVYDTLQVLPISQVPDHMWNMSVPAGFRMGTLPQKP